MQRILIYLLSYRGNLKFNNRIRSLICQHFHEKLLVKPLQDALKNNLGHVGSVALPKNDLLILISDIVLGDPCWEITLCLKEDVLPGSVDLCMKKIK